MNKTNIKMNQLVHIFFQNMISLLDIFYPINKCGDDLMFFYVLIWSYSACFTSNTIQRYFDFLIELEICELPKKNKKNLFEYYFDGVELTIRNIESNIQIDYPLNMQSIKMCNLKLPTVENKNLIEIIQKLVDNNHNIFITGEIGTGKSFIVESIKGENFHICLNRNTTFSDIYNEIEAEYRFKKCIDEKTVSRINIFIEDINILETNSFVKEILEKNYEFLYLFKHILQEQTFVVNTSNIKYKNKFNVIFTSNSIINSTPITFNFLNVIL